MLIRYQKWVDRQWVSFIWWNLVKFMGTDGAVAAPKRKLNLTETVSMSIRRKTTKLLFSFHCCSVFTSLFLKTTRIEIPVRVRHQFEVEHTHTQSRIVKHDIIKEDNGKTRKMNIHDNATFVCWAWNSSA